MYDKNIIIIKTCVSVIRCKKDDKKIELFREIKRKYSDNIFIVNTIFCENNMRTLNLNIDVKIIFILVYIFVAYIYLLKRKVSYLHENNKSTFTFLCS